MPTLSTFATKRCTKCGHNLPLSAFSKRSNSKDGLEYRCKECKSACDRLHHAANRDKRNSRKREYKKSYYRTPKGFTTRLWSRINSRAANGSHLHQKNEDSRRSYLRKGIELRIARAALYQLVLANWDLIKAIWATGEQVNLHRINNDAHYEIGNLQFLPRNEHRKLHIS